MLIENQLKKLGFGAAALFLLIVAALLGASQMYLMAIILALVPLAGGLINRILMRGLVCERTASEFADEYGKALVTVTIRNEGRLPKFYIRTLDALPRFVRYAGSPENEAVFLTRLWPGESEKVRYYIEPQKRGLHRIGPLAVHSTDIFGFSDFHKTIDSYSEILVYPEILPVVPFLLSSGAATGWRDEQDARSRGNGSDFNGVREYRPGDELRRINWKTTARTGTLAVTEYTQGYASDLVIILDCEAAIYENSGAGKLSAFESAVTIATTLGATALRRGSKVKLSMARTDGERPLELQREMDLGLLLDNLARVEADGRVTLTTQLEDCVRETTPGSIVVVVTPHSQDDQRLREALEPWRRQPLSADLHLFWLNRESFAKVQDDAQIAGFTRASDFATASGSGYKTFIAVEYVVNADTSLISLLGGDLLDNHTSLSQRAGEETSGVAPIDEDALSPPLYIAALIAMLAALAAVNSVLGVDELAVTSIVLSILGFTFSFACRWYRISPKLLNGLAYGIMAYLLLRVITGSISISALVPTSTNQGDLQLAVILDWVAVIYCWTVVDDKKVVMSAILSIAMIGLVAAYDVNIDLVIYFLAYVLATIFLLIHQNYLLHRSWGKTVDDVNTEWRLFNAQVALSAACGVAVFLGALVLVVPVKAILSHLTLGKALHGLIDFDRGAQDNVAPSDNFFDDPTFPIGQGDGFSASGELVMRVKPSDNQEHYWRGRTYDHYSLQGWLSTSADVVTPLQPIYTPSTQYPIKYDLPPTLADAPIPASVKPTKLETTFNIEEGETKTIYTPDHPQYLDASSSMQGSLSISNDGQIGLGQLTNSFEYRVSSLNDPFYRADFAYSAGIDDPTIQILRHAKPNHIPTEIRRLYVDQTGSDVSTDDKTRLFDTVIGIMRGKPASRLDAFDRAEAIRDWVSKRAVYSLSVPPIPPGADPVSYFLFTSRSGYCDMFASSMAILCRYDGLPARVVTGFAPGARSDQGGFDVKLKDKHAWCEVYFQGYGWVLFDPTEGSVLASGVSKDQSANMIWDQLVARIRSFLIANGPVPIALLLVVIGCGTYVIKVEVIDRLRIPRTVIRRIRRKAGEVLVSVEEARYARMAANERWEYVQAALRRWGIKQQPSETTLEFVVRVETLMHNVEARSALKDGSDLSDYDATCQALGALAKSFLTARYAPEDDLLVDLVRLERDGSADKNLNTVQNTIAQGRRAAREVQEATAPKEHAGSVGR